MATIAYSLRYFVVGFLHLVLLGAISSSLFGFAMLRGLLNGHSIYTKMGILLFLIGFTLTEVFLFTQGAMVFIDMELPKYFEILLGASFLLVLGIGMLGIGGVVKKSITDE